MSKINNLTGKKFGRLTVLEKGEDFVSPSGNKQSGWVCKCECGKIITVRANGLTSGNTRSCGCLYEEAHNKQKGLSKSKLYNIWSGMKKRCYSENHHAYKNYGGRGIVICEEWKNNFLSFYDWAISNGYREGLSMDREDNNGNYEPDNCAWKSSKMQNNNRRCNHSVEFNGKSLTLAQWEDETGIRQETIRRRLSKGWSVQDALTTKNGEKRNEGETL